MATPVYELKKRVIDRAILLNTPTAATDVVLALGNIKFLDESGAIGLNTKWSNITGAKKTVYAAGTANVKKVDFAATTLVALRPYTLTLRFPNVKDFFGGGKEQSAVFQPRTYVVTTDAIPTATELTAAFEAAIENDLSSGVTVVNNGTNLDLTSISVYAGEMLLTVPTGTVITNSTPWVSPSGTPAEVMQYVNPSGVLVAGEYTRYEFRWNKAISHNAVLGMNVYKEVAVFLYIEENAGAYAATATKIDSIIAGTYTPVADFLGTTTLP